MSLRFALGTPIAVDGAVDTLPLDVDLDRLIGGHACVVANSGGGKSGAVRRLLEVTYGHVQQIVLDPEDEFYTLRERFDFVIAGGDGADAPATVAGAAALARACLESSFNLVVQLNDPGEDAPAFVGSFLEALIAAPRELWRPLLVVVDEAHRFAPQDGRTEASAGMKALTGQGRKRGYTAVLASQRIAKIAADVRGDVNNWLLGRVGQALDRNTMADQLGFSGKEGRERLQGLEARQFWAMGPALATEPVLFRVDDVETTPVRPGQAKVATPPPPEALRKILAGLAAAAAAPVSEAPVTSDPSIPAEAGGAYRVGSAAGQLLSDRDKRIAELERQLTANAEEAAAAEDRRTAFVAFLQAVRIAVADLVAGIDEAIELDSTSAKVAGVAEEVVRSGASSAPHPDAAAGDALAAGTGAAAAAPPPAAAARPLDALPNKTRALLNALARYHPRSVSIEHLAELAGVGIKSSQWPAHFRAFKESRLALLMAANGQWRLSSAGVAALGAEPQPDGAAALLGFWVKGLQPAHGRMLTELVKAREQLSADDVAARAGISLTSSTVGSGLKELRDHGLIEKVGDRYRAIEALL